MDHFDAVDVPHAKFERRLRLVRGDQWADPTPCPEWTVRDLVNHVVSAPHTYALLVNGCSREEASGDLGAEALGPPAGGVLAPRRGAAPRAPPPRCAGTGLHAP